MNRKNTNLMPKLEFNCATVSKIELNFVQLLVGPKLIRHYKLLKRLTKELTSEQRRKSWEIP